MMQQTPLSVLIRRIRALPQYLKDPGASLRKKLLIIFGIVYLLCPMDLIPAPVLLFSWVDDLVLWLFILKHLADELDRYEIPPRTGASKGNGEFAGKTIIHDINYEVREEEDPPEEKER